MDARWPVIWIAALSVVDFVLAVIDKSRARHGATRIRERTLLGLAALGGSPGLILAMLLVRHKTRKAGFLFPLALIVALQLGLAFWLLV